mmetsp:Transcript_18932/g.33629  ORF Transcript_18932/g.33629 Transcript_18932/m.33629 type:complete len:211 (-) Transcript_18932:327-959(-)
MANSKDEQLDVLSWTPLAETGTGPLFPGVVSFMTEAEDTLRSEMTSFKGQNEAEDNTWEYRVHPLALRDSKGFLNPHGITIPLNAVNSHYVHDLSKTDMEPPIDEEHDVHAGVLLQSKAVSPMYPWTAKNLKPTKDPGQEAAQIEAEYQRDFDEMRAERIARIALDPRTSETSSALVTEYLEARDKEAEKKARAAEWFATPTDSYVTRLA